MVAEEFQILAQFVLLVLYYSGTANSAVHYQARHFLKNVTGFALPTKSET